jgi:hypothetical protein
MLCFNYTVGFPIVRNSSKVVVRRPPGAPGGAATAAPLRAPAQRPRPATPGGAVVRGAAQAPRSAARWAQPLEPILIPKLRIYFADFPYLHCSIN